MLPRTQPFQSAGSGDTHAGLFEDIGTRSLQTVRVGEGAGKVSSGVGNAFVGYETGKQNAGGSYGTFVGYQAGAQNTVSSYSTMVGAFAGRENLRGSEVVFVGYKAGELNKDGDRLVAIGSYALRENYSGTGSVAIGFRAAERTLDGDYNVVIGTESCQDLRSGNYNTSAGFRSGRAAYQGNENCYFGAFSGYSNSVGDGNCLIGYKAGENLAIGSYNVGVGAFTLRNAQNGSCNVAIGPFAGANMTASDGSVIIGNNASANSTSGDFNVVVGTNAGSSNDGNNNVLLGANVATKANVNSTVIIGADAATNVTGDASVIIGAGIASSIREGYSNVLIGHGADGYRARVISAIAIGTSNTYTSTNSISIGDDIVNERTSSILLGYQLKSDANNSVVMGNDINIQSVIYWKDPLNYALTDTVRADAITKLGISNITYGSSNQILVSPSGEIYINAKVGLITSNTYNSINSPQIGRTSPSSYDLRTAVSPCNFLIVNGLSKPLRTNSDLSAPIYLNDMLATLDTSIPIMDIDGVQSLCNLTLFGSNLLFKHSSNFNFYVSPACNVIANIIDINAPSATASLIIPKAVAAFHATSNASNIAYTQVVPSSSYSPAVAVPPAVTAASYGITSLSNAAMRYTIIRPPSLGKLDAASYQTGDTMAYTPFYEATFADKDSFVVRPVLEITDADQNIYGCPSSNDVEITIDFVAPDTVFQAPLLTSIDRSNIILSSNIVRTIPSQIAASTPIRVLSLTSNMTLSVDNQVYTSNIIARMVEDEIYKYPQSEYANYLSTARQDAQSITMSNVDIFNMVYGYFYTTTVPILTDALSNHIATLSNITSWDEVYDPFLQITLSNPVYTLPSPTDPVFADLSNVTIKAIAVPTDFPASYTTFSNVFSSWVDEYDPTLSYTEIGTIQSSNIQLETQYLNDTSYAYDSNVAIYSNSLDIATSSNELVVATNTLLEFLDVHPSTTSYATYPNVLSSIQDIQKLVYKYYDAPRLFLSYADMISERIQLIIDQTTPQLNNESVTLQVGNPPNAIATIQYPIMFASQSFWQAPASVIPTITIPRDKSVPSLLLYDNAINNADHIYVNKYPQHGALTFLPSSNTLYTLINPWMQTSDLTNFVIEKGGQTKDVYATVQYNSTNVAHETSLVIPCPPSTSNVTATYLTVASVNEEYVSLSNVITTSLSNIYADGSSNASTQTNVVLIQPGQYDSVRGALIATSNIVTSNVIVEVYHSINDSNIRSNIYQFINNTTYTEYRDNAYWAQVYIPSTSNFIEEIGSNVTVSSNITVYHTSVIDHYYTRKSDLYITNVSSDQEHYFHFATHDPSYFLYNLNGSVVPRSDSYIETTSNIVIATRSTVSIFTSNLTVHSNVSVFDPLFPLTRNVLFHGSPSTIYNVTETQNIDVVRSNTGVITQFTQQSLDVGNTWLRLKQPSTSNLLQFQGIGVDSASVNVTLASIASALPEVDMGAEVITIGPSYQVSNLSVWDNAVATASLSFIPDTVHIHTLQYGSLHNSIKHTMTFEFADRDKIHYVATNPSITLDHLSFYFSSNESVFSPLMQVGLHVQHDPLSSGLDVNMGLSYQASNALSPNVFSIARGPIAAIHTKINVTSSNNANVSKSTFTMAEVLSGGIYVSAQSNAKPSSFTYNVIDDTTSQIINTGQEFVFNPYYHVSFPTMTTVNGATAINIEQLGYATRVSNKLVGPLWNYLSNLHTPYRGRESLSNIMIHVASPLQHGFLWDEQRQRILPSTFTVQDYVNNLIHYIPYASNFVPNETFDARVLYQNNASPLYTISLKNYISRFPAISIDPTIQEVRARTLQLAPSILRSQGLIDDGYEWYPQNALTLPLQNVAPLQNTSILASLCNTTTAENLRQEAIIINPYTHSIPLTWQDESHVQVTIDQVDQWSLTPLLSRVSCNVLEERDIVFYVNTPPSQGIVLNTATKSNIVTFTSTDLIEDRIVYQHIGANTSNDNFSIGLSSTPYDLISSDLQIHVAIREIPRFTANLEQFLYHSNVAHATSTLQRFGSNLQVEGVDGYVHVLSSNVNIPSIFPTSALTSNTIGYYIPSQYFAQYGSNAPFPKLQMDVTVNSTSTAGYLNVLARDYPIYRSIFVLPFEANLNRYVSSNIITQAQDSVQELSYSIDRTLSASSNLAGRIVSYFLQVRPDNGVFDEGILTDLQQTQTQHLRTLDFSLDFVDELGSTLVRMEFDHTSVTISTATTIQRINIPENLRLTFGDWHNFLFVNEDPDNGKYASLYVDYDSTQSRVRNSDRNILRGFTISIADLGVLEHIYLRTDMQSASNYKGAATQFTKQGASNESLGTVFELEHDRTAIQFRNQEVFITTYTLEETETGIVSSIESLNHNVVIGKEITVRGTNNICIGNRFVTSGKNSIIVGNDIGSGVVEVGTINDVYESIVIGNESFQNSIVRDVISIGNRNLNNLYLSPVDKVNDFLSQRPILIGNDITQDRLDFNINIGNAFTKTIIGGQQIYLGLNGETVGVGYTSNTFLSDSYKLHVNGSVKVHGGLETPKVYGARDIVKATLRLDVDPNVAIGDVVVIQDYNSNVFTVLPTSSTCNVAVFGILESISTPSIGSVRTSCEVCVRGMTFAKVKAPFEVGDLIVTSDTYGVCQVANSTLKHSYTFAKVLASSTTYGTGTVFVAPCQLL